ncbi:MAG: type II toxin-antitoxin system HicA family toxin [Calditrichaeota bacterium]|nr:type II toxin-antitoxin system HicA family toxin [Calditrichota bacterium]
MSRREKLIAKMKANPHRIRFTEMQTIVNSEGFVKFNQRGSHVTFRHQDGRRFTLTIPHGRESYLWASQVIKTLEKIGL